MVITIGEGSQYILFLLCLCGEAKHEALLSNAALSESYTSKVLRRMTADKLIRKVTFCAGDGEEKELIRMRDSWAEGAVKELSGELSLHYDLMVGKPGNRFKGSQAHRERLYKMGTLVQIIYESGVMVDLIRHEHVPNDFGKSKNNPARGDQPYGIFGSFLRDKTIFDAQGDLLMPEEIFSRLGSDQICFLTSRALSGQRGERYKNSKNLMNRMYGIFVSGKTMYNTYYITAAGEMWWKDVERQAMAITQRYQRTLYPDSSAGEGAAIFYVSDPEVLYHMFFPVKKTRARIYPPDVYAKSYMLPLTENHIDLRTMLLTEDWERKLKKLLLKEKAAESEIYDGIMNGYETYILLASDMTRMTQLIPRLKNHPSIVVIHEWQKTLATALYQNAKQIVFTAEEFESLTDDLQAMD